MTKCKLSPMGLGLALGTLWALSVFLVALLAYLGFEGGLVAMLHHMNGEYEPSLVGIVVAALVAMVDGFIHGALVAWLYNWFANCCCKKNGKCE